MTEASRPRAVTKASRLWARGLFFCGVVLLVVGGTAQFWALFGGHRLQPSAEYVWRGEWPIYLVGKSGSENIEPQGAQKFTRCAVTSSDSKTVFHDVQTVRLSKMGLYGSRISPPSNLPAVVTCDDSVLTTGPIVYVYPFAGPLILFGVIFAIAGRSVGWPRNRPHFGKWNLRPT